MNVLTELLQKILVFMVEAHLVFVKFSDFKIFSKVKSKKSDQGNVQCM